MIISQSIRIKISSYRIQYSFQDCKFNIKEKEGERKTIKEIIMF